MKWNVNIGRIFFDPQFDLSVLISVWLNKQHIKSEGDVVGNYEIIHSYNDMPKLYFRPRWTNGAEKIISGDDLPGYLCVRKETPDSQFEDDAFAPYIYKVIAPCFLTS